MNSSEWKILRQWLEFGEISEIDQLIVKIHLHWSGKLIVLGKAFRPNLHNQRRAIFVRVPFLKLYLKVLE